MSLSYLATATNVGMNFKDVATSLLMILLVVLIIGAISLASKMVEVWVEKVRTDIDTKEIAADNELVQNTIYSATEIIRDVVKELENTLKKEILEKSKDGKLTKEEGREILSTAVKKIKEQLSDDLLDNLGILVNDTDSWIITKIETALSDLKKNDVIYSRLSIPTYSECRLESTIDSEQAETTTE